jgi:hypothetical protein
MSNHVTLSKLSLIALSALACAALAPSTAVAQDIAVSNRTANQFEAVAARAEATDEHRLRLQAGGALVEGNSRSLSANVAARYQLRRGANELTAESNLNLGFAVNQMMAAAGYQRNAENYLLRARYDRYFGDNSIWVSPLFFRDTFAGFAARTSGQVGYLRNFYNDPGRRKFKGEFGVDLTYEILEFTAAAPARCPTGTAAGMAGMPNQCGALAFMGRIYLGYEDNTSSMFSFNAGLETLVNFLGLATPNAATPGVNAPPDIRVNLQTGLAFKVSDFFSVGAQYNLRALVQPVGNAQSLDHNLLLTINFSHSFDAPPPPAAPAAPAAPACPTCPECPTPAADATAPATAPVTTTTTTTSTTSTTTTPAGSATVTAPSGSATVTTPVGGASATTTSTATATTTPTPR